VNTLYLDLETYSDVPITHGTHAYAEKAEVLLTAMQWNDEPIKVWEEFDGRHVQFMVDSADKIVIHNSAFDRTVLRHCGVHVPVEKIEDTMVMALAHSLPGSLGQLCDILKVPTDKAKDKEGKKLLNLFCKPRPKNVKLRRATAETHPEEWQAFCAYACSDITAMREVYKLLPRWNWTPSERRLWLLDQTVNDRGIAVDVGLARAALRAADRSGVDLARRSNDLTDGGVKSTTQRNVLKQYIDTEHGVEMADVTKGTVTDMLKGDLDPDLRELLVIRQQASATSPAKYRTLLQGVSADGRLRGTLQFCGAMRTGRWGGRLFQPQNLPRPTMKQAAIEAGIAAMKLDCEDLVVDNVMELCASAVRGSLVASPGKKLVISDLSNIEGRVAAWIAGEDWKLDAFKAYDKSKSELDDIYVRAYAKAFGVTPEQVIDNKKTGDGMMRQLGKIMELALGFGGSIGAFSTMAKLYGVELPEEEILRIVKAWRKAHPRIVSYWYDLESAVRWAVNFPGERSKLRDIEIDVVDDWLRVRLPSGRYLCYPNIAKNDNDIVYDGVNQYTRKWERIKTYGGKLFENIVQATARDVLAHGMLKAEETGYPVCLHVHDELITEVPDDVDYTVLGLSSRMGAATPWSMGLPLAAAGFETQRYRKD
jgi:DNA polymerase bacteriophage-type